MAITLVLEGAADDRCIVRLSPIAELSAALHALNEIDHHPRSHEWADLVRRTVPGALLDQVRAWAPLWGSLRARFLMPLDDGPQRTLAKEISDIETLGERHFVAMCAEAIVDRDRTVRYERLGDDRSAVQRFRDRARQLSATRLTLAEKLLADPGSLRADVVGFLRAFARYAFDEEWEAQRPLLMREARQRAREVERRGLGVLTSLSKTVHECNRPRRVVFDKLYDGSARIADQVCLIVPSVHVRPHVAIKHNAGLPIVVQYPVGGTNEVTYDLVRTRMLVLSDPIRIRMCRWILREPHTTSDLARRMGMSQPQVSRHLRRLRDAGLVRTWREGRLVFYALDPAPIDNLGSDLVDALRR
ncbi:MAG: metalloregulator ArsR/SmtB family transcription factor [Streptosporangiales bacterium]|nr:metalloregulator ArsR/SmtB family transcription factor [Streptosporangiales bacterium]